MSSVNEIVRKLKESRIHEAEEDDRAQMVRDMQNNATYKKAKSIVEKHGYEIDPHCYVTVYPSGDKYIYFNVRGNNRYDPDIYYRNQYDSDYEFAIQTTSYGALNLEDHSKFIERVTEAHKMVEELSKLDMYSLYEYHRED